ncbi:MAG: hypothetical protein ABIP71_09780 [Verrucomicrobiota bacterium]
MKITNFFFLVFGVCLMTLTGCQKQDQQGSVQPFHGINVDWPKLETEFAKAGPDVQENLTLINRFFRYAQFTQALMELDKLSNNPNLTEPQKKLVSDLIQQTKQEIAKAPTQSGQ